MEKYSVTFMPEKITVSVMRGTNLLIAAKKAGINIESPCGAHGTCGKCAVKIISGACGMHDDSHLSQELKDAGYMLACQIKVKNDMTIEVPNFSRLTRHKVVLSSKRTKFNRENDYFAKNKINPICKKYFVKLEKPDLSDSLNDLDRLKAVLSREHGLNNVDIGLSCLRGLPDTVREGNWEVTITIAEISRKSEIVRIESGRSIRPIYGLAVDIGTTTVVVNLLDTEKGRIIDKAGTYNQQSVYGSDVISRIIYTDENPEGLELLQKAVVKTINELINEVLSKNEINSEDIPVMVCAGNTVMSHLFMGLKATYLRVEPYVPGTIKFPAVKAKELNIGINPDAYIITIPSVASYVGGDITAGVLATMVNHSKALTLFIDIGTNGELVLGNDDWMVTCSCSAGPAFEGSGISCGMRAMEGAIDRIEIDPDTLDVITRTIGDIKPLGICGSGLIYSLSEMMEAGIIDRAGKILDSKKSSRIRTGNEGIEYVLVYAEKSGSGQDIVITEGDIKNLLRAKGAIFAGIRTMLQQVQLDVTDIDRVYIAGGFGNYINITDAINIGLLPDLPFSKFEYVGNSCIQGAMTVLLSQEALIEVEDIADRMTYLELSIGNHFMDEFISALFIPHTDLSLFPTTVGKNERNII